MWDSMWRVVCVPACIGGRSCIAAEVCRAFRETINAFEIFLKSPCDSSDTLKYVPSLPILVAVKRRTLR